MKQFAVRITETTVYSRVYSLAELVELTGESLDGLDDEEIADIIDGNPAVEESLQRYGDVVGSAWRVMREEGIGNE